MPLKQITNFLKQTNELQTAELLLDTFSKYSKENFQFDELAQLYYEIKRYDKSSRFAEKALVTSKNPQEMYSVRANLAKVYNHMNEPKKALKNIKLNIGLNHTDYEARMEYIFSLYLLGQYSECESYLREMLKEDLPENIKDRVMFNLATYVMEAGSFKTGFMMFTTYGKKVDVFRKINPPVVGMEEWDGVSTDKKVLVLHRGGIGDELINIRFMKNLQEMGLDPVWLTSFKDLAPVFNRSGFKTITHISELINPNDYVYYSSMDLPYTLNLEKSELGRTPYLTADPEYIDKHQRYTGGVGVKWAGNKDYEHDLHRSLPLQEVINVTNTIPTCIYSLQKEDYDEIETLSPFDNIQIIDLHHKLENIEDTLGIISNLDYVITSCTSIAHMCGAIGKKVYVLPPISCYYVWLGRTDNHSDWYGDYVTVIRQTEWKSWDKPLKILKELLHE